MSKCLTMDSTKDEILSQNGIGVILKDTIPRGIIIPNKYGQSIGVK